MYFSLFVYNFSISRNINRRKKWIQSDSEAFRIVNYIFSMHVIKDNVQTLWKGKSVKPFVSLHLNYYKGSTIMGLANWQVINLLINIFTFKIKFRDKFLVITLNNFHFLYVLQQLDFWNRSMCVCIFIPWDFTQLLEIFQ